MPRSRGLYVRPCRSFSEKARIENAGAFVRPMITAPAARSAARPDWGDRIVSASIPTWPAEGTAEVAARVAEARRIQSDRAAKHGDGVSPLNARAEGAWLETIAALDAPASALLARAAEAGGLSARGWTRTIRLARTIADREGAPSVRRVHIAEALIYRRIAPAAESLGEHRASAYEL